MSPLDDELKALERMIPKLRAVHTSLSKKKSGFAAAVDEVARELEYVAMQMSQYQGASS